MENQKTPVRGFDPMKKIKYIDLFCGIGGFRYAVEQACKTAEMQAECVLSSDIDPDCQKAYAANFGEEPKGDIAGIPAEAIPDHTLLVGGFPCQPFSIIGRRKGFDDARGTLFFEIARIIQAKRPSAFVLENVKQLVGHNSGKTLSRIMDVLAELGYHASYRVYNALDFGLPQKRERVFIVGFDRSRNFAWPEGGQKMKPLKDIVESDPDKSYSVSDHIRRKRTEAVATYKKTEDEITIWHENKNGHIGIYPYSCALRAGASYNYLLVNGERRLTSREMLRLQGFPDSFKLIAGYSVIRKQAGNSLPIPVAKAVVTNVLEALRSNTVRMEFEYPVSDKVRQLSLCEKGKKKYGKKAEAKKR